MDSSLFQIKEVGIIPLYRCNLRCDFCLFSFKHESKELLDLDYLEGVFSVLLSEGNQIRSISIFGGEITLLPDSYLDKLFCITRKYFPEAKVGVVSNLIELRKSFLSLLCSHEIDLSTSYDEFRFSGEKAKLKNKWVDNFERMRDVTGNSPLVLVADSPHVERIFDFLSDLGVDKVQPLRLFVPEEAEDGVAERLLKYTLPPDHFAVTVNKATSMFKTVILPNERDVSIVNTVIILPEGKVVLHGEGERGYPFERFYRFDSLSEKTITFSRSRMEYILRHVNTFPCNLCSVPQEKCLAEIRYSNICMGHL